MDGSKTKALSGQVMSYMMTELDIEQYPITFWQNMPSHHMAPVQRELAKIWHGGVRVVSVNDVSQERRNMGWANADLGQAQHVILNGDATHASQLARQNTGVNLFGGIGEPVLARAWRALPQSHRTYRGLILEGGNPLGFKGRLRPLFHRLKLRRLNDDLSLVLAFGEQGVRYYKKAGISQEKIFPFMYQCEASGATSSATVSSPPRLVYVGSFSKRKGVDLMLRGLGKLRNKEWQLTMIGAGPGLENARRLSNRLGIGNRVSWLGGVPSAHVPFELEKHDICLVPSRFDGWGMAVNEAIEAGLAVIASPRVGASVLIKKAGTGVMASSASSDSIASSLKVLLDNGARLEESKVASRSLRDKIRGKNAARYLLHVIEYTLGHSNSQPVPPWEN